LRYPSNATLSAKTQHEAGVRILDFVAVPMRRVSTHHAREKKAEPTVVLMTECDEIVEISRPRIPNANDMDRTVTARRQSGILNAIDNLMICRE
jgi:hypothetical protein